MQICYLVISPGLRPLRFPGAEALRLLNMFKNVQDLECQDKSLLCFLYAGFGSPNIHLTFLVSKFAVAQSRETFEKWLLA